MNRQTIGAMMENYDVAMLAGHNVMYYSDSLKGDSVHKSFESHSKVIQNSHFDLSSIIFSTIFFEIYEISVAKGKETNMYNIFSCYYRVHFRSPEFRSDR